jgi:hypothetical protein
MPRPRSRRSNSKKPKRLAKVVAWSALGLLVLLVAAFVGVRLWFNAYLASPEFQRLMGALTARHLHSQGDYQPIRFSGTTVFSDGFSAEGDGSALFSTLRADQLRADFNPRGLFDGVWQIDDITAQRLEVELDGPRIRLPEPTPAETSRPKEAKTPRRGWIPRRIDIRAANIRELVLRWGADGTRPSGALDGTAVTIVPTNPGGASEDSAWEISGNGGVLAQQGFSPLTVDSVRMRYRGDALYVTEATFAHDGGGTVSVNGEVRFGDGLAFEVELSNVPVTPYIPEDWRAKFTGQLQGRVRIASPMPLTGKPDIEGSVRVTEGQLQALPLLDRIALFTRTQQFRRLDIRNTSGDFRRTGDRLEVTNFVAESPGLIRIQGAFAVENDEIEGAFEVGITPGSLRWLPGSQERVFTTARDGYLWAPMRLTGPLDSPREDLTARLTVAAAEEILGEAEDVDEKVRDAARDILDFVSPLLR